MLSDRAIQLIADAKIEAAKKSGDFENLQGFGKPFEFDELNIDSNWWIRRKIENEKIKELSR